MTDPVMTSTTVEAPPPTTDATGEPQTLPPPTQFVGTFDDLNIPEGIRRGLKDLGYLGPTKVQRDVFMPVLGGADVLVQSRTGSGKTTAFCLPMLCSIDVSVVKPQAIVLTPTRELALQVSAEASRLGKHQGVRVGTIYGGASMRAQIDALQQGLHVVVGTPGRIKDLFRQGVLSFSQIRFAILDEADEMLSRGFWDEVTSLLDQLPDARQTMLFSATLPDQVERAAKRYLRDPQRIDLSRDTLNVTTIRHVLHHEKEAWSKHRNFLYVLEFHKPEAAIVFCNRKDETELLVSYLRRFGYRAEALNGDMTQAARERTLARVKGRELDLMIATDVAARGIDISDLRHIFNYDLPEHDEVYVHRCGRTGRIGKSGTAVSLVRGKYLSHLTTLQKTYRVPFEELVLPDEKEILWMQAERLAVQILEDAAGVEVEQYRPVAESLLARGDVKEILAFLLRTHYAVGTRSPVAAGPNEGFAPAPRADRGPPRDRGPRRDDRPRDDRPRDDRPRDDRPRDDRPRDDRPRDDRPREARPRRDDDAPPVDTGSRNLYVTLGKADGVADLTALAAKLAAMAGVDTAHFTGQGDVRDHSAHVEVDKEVAEKIIASVHGQVRGGVSPPKEDGTPGEPRTILCELAKTQPGERRPRRFDRGDRGDRGPRRDGPSSN
jgi:ATP-dependent RNA helicase DeaD